MQQATANLFADMGVQPATLQGGLIPTSKSIDTQPPASTITSPNSGVTVQFGIPVTVTGTATDFGGGVVAGVEVSTDGGRIWHAASGRQNWSYTWTPSLSGSINILSRAVDDSANMETPSAGVVVTVPRLPLSIDASVSADGLSASTTIKSPSFSTSAGNELILAFVSADYTTGANTTVSGITGAGLTWSLVVRANTQSGTSEIWRSLALSPVSGTVTATLSQSAIASITVMSFSGVNTTGTNGSGAIGAVASKGAASGAPSLSVVTTQNDSWVLGVGNDYDTATPRTLGPGQSLVHQVLTTSGDTYWVQQQSSPTLPAGSTVLTSDTAPTTDRWNLAVAEILPGAPGALSISGTISPSTIGSGTTLTLSGTVSTATVGDNLGTYSFTGLINGSYTITPSKTGVVFSPPSQTVLLNGSNLSGINFTSVTLSSIAISPANPTIQAGGVQQFTATGTYSDGSTKNITPQVSWSSSNTGVATIDNSGLATAVAGGTSTVTATVGTISGATTFTVQGPSLAITTASLPNGIQNQLYSAVLTATGGVAPYTWSIGAGTSLPAGLTLSPGGQITGTPTIIATSTFTVQVKDSGTTQQSATKQLTISVTAAPVLFTIWGTSSAPVTADAGPDSAVELGVKFRADVSGMVTGIRFYKSSGNTGTHIGNLWNSTGTLLASVTFNGESASGWQQATFSTPVAITAGTIYVASYHTNVGHYSDDQNYFASTGIDAPPLHALQEGVSGANGVFAYGTGSVFPTGGFKSSNYWVDVVFAPSVKLKSIAVNPTTPTIVAGATQQFAATGTYNDGSTQVITNQVSWSSSATSVATINTSGLASGIAGGSSNITATQGTISGGTTLNVQSATLVINTTVLPTGLQNQPYSATLTAGGGTAPYAWSLVSGTSLPAGLSLSSAGQISGAPTGIGTSTFSVQVSDGGSPVQTVIKQLSIAVNAAPVAYTIWSAGTVPTVTDAGPDSGVELGIKFQSDVSGTIAGIRFYKSSANTGTHVGNLWSSAGALLASAAFTNETPSGWQEVDFSTPVPITPGTIYVASYHTSVGHYSADQNYFVGAGVDTPPLHALADGASGADGVFGYGSTSVFPNGGFASSNYWVDVVLVPSATLTSIMVTPVNPTIQAGSTQQFTATGTYSDGSTQNVTAQVVWSSSNTNVATINNSGAVSGLTAGTSIITAAIGSLNDHTTATVQPAAGVSSTIWSSSTVPTLIDAGADASVELGVKFTSDVNGSITGLRFYKSSTNTGTHIGNLWSSSGTLLATATFTNETASGWQQVNFSKPVAITSGTVYVASYHVSRGHYSLDQNYFAVAGVNSPPLHALVDGSNGSDGVFAYGTRSVFPSSGFKASNYWVDVVFVAAP
jgi:uncharacterized protein YjdB